MSLTAIQYRNVDVYENNNISLDLLPSPREPPAYDSESPVLSANKNNSVRITKMIFWIYEMVEQISETPKY